jgi:hypothetical protein
MSKNLRLTGLAALALAFLALPASSQTYERRASFVQGGGAASGRCTVEVFVDNTAEVTVTGDRGSIHTISGAPATFQRMECTSSMPVNMTDFQVRSITPAPRGLVGALVERFEPSGVQVVEDPRSSGGNAVIRIHDTGGGPGVYTLDLSWSGANYGGRVATCAPPPEPDRRVDAITTYRGEGEGHFRNREISDRIVGCTVTINGEQVQASFVTVNGTPIDLTGQVHHADRNRVVADMSGSGIYGTMYIDLDRGRVRNVSMSNGGRNSVDLRWHY